MKTKAIPDFFQCSIENHSINIFILFPYHAFIFAQITRNVSVHSLPSNHCFFLCFKKKCFLFSVSFYVFMFSTELYIECLNFCFILGSGGYNPASKAFLFSLYNEKGYNPVKLTQYQNQQHAMYKSSSYGPTFGVSTRNDIRIVDNALSNQNSYSACGQTYSVPSGYSAGQCGFFTGGFYFTPTDIEVFYEIGN